jgi:hypothetical protein
MLVNDSQSGGSARILIQFWLWLEGNNIPGLSAATSGILAKYGLSENEARRMLVVCPRAAQASAAPQVLPNHKVQGLVIATVQDKILGAVFAESDPANMVSLLKETMK